MTGPTTPRPVAPRGEPPERALGSARRPIAIAKLLDSGSLDTAAIDAWLAAHSVPIVEGTAVTFLFRGEAEAVQLRHFIYGLQSTQPFTRVEATDLWYLVLEIPAASRFEYKIEVVRNGLLEELATIPSARQTLLSLAEMVRTGQVVMTRGVKQPADADIAPEMAKETAASMAEPSHSV